MQSKLQLFTGKGDAGTYPSHQRWFLPVSAGTYPSGQRWFLPVSATLLRT